MLSIARSEVVKFEKVGDAFIGDELGP
jgi:hypothetical protein